MGRNNKAFRAANAELEKLYASLPHLDCKGLCQASCGPVDECVAPIERTRIARFVGGAPAFSGAPRMGQNHVVLTCPQLSPEGRCRIHAIRPLICRLWGMVDHELMRCPWGCRPDRYLSNDEVRKLWAKIGQIAAPPPA